MRCSPNSIMRFTIGEQDHDAGPGTLVMVPTGAPHTFANPGDEPAVLLTAFTPDLYVQYFRDLRGVAAAGPRRAAPLTSSWPATPPNRRPSTNPDWVRTCPPKTATSVARAR